MKAAFHIDQLWFATPGGIGTYVRELGAALFDAENVDVVPFHSSWRTPARGRAWYPAVEVPGSIRTLYPSWDVLGRLLQSLMVAGFVADFNNSVVTGLAYEMR